MKIENLKEGMVIKNYKELCNVLEIKVKEGKGKQLQFKELNRFCAFHKDKYKFIIDEIYKKAKAKSTNKNSKYVDEIGEILVDYLHRNSEETSYSTQLTFNQLLEIFGMINKNYVVGNRYKRALSNVLDVDIISVYYFYNNISNEFKQILERALNSLKSRNVLNYDKCIVICKIKNDKLKYVQADDEEEEKIINIEKATLIDLKLKDKRDLFLQNKIKEFQENNRKKLPDDWKYYFYAYDLRIGNRAIEIEHNSIEEKRLSLNEKMKERAKSRLKVNSEEQDEQKLIDNLIDIIKCDSTLENKIHSTYKKLYKEKNQELTELLEQELKINEKMKKIHKDSSNEIDMNNYFAYNRYRKEYYEFKDLFDEFEKNYKEIEEI